MINWIKLTPLYFAISTIVLVSGIYSLARYGLKLSVEFTGGSILEISDTTLASDQIKQRLPSINIYDIIQKNTSTKISMDTITQAELSQILDSLSVDAQKPQVVNFETVGPALGRETLLKTVNAIALAAFLILLYVAKVFKNFKYGLCAVLAMIHDSLVLIGSFSILGHFLGIETDLLFVTAVLTTLSFSVHDTIVVYDRIRELGRKHPRLDITALANRSISDTMIRSLNNSLTIIFMLLALVLMGGNTIHGFALALLIGAITGTYSSPFTAVPLLVIFSKHFSSKNK